MLYTALAATEPKMILYSRYIRKRAFEFESECLPFHVLFWLEEGRFSYRIEGYGEGIAEAGDLLFCPANARFHREMLMPSTLHVLRITLQPTPSVLPPLCTRIVDRERITRDVRFLSHNIGTQQKKLAVEQHYMTDLWYLLLEENDLLSYAERAPIEDTLIAEVAEYIDHHLQASLEIDLLASRCALSPGGFIRRFHRALGVTPRQYIIDRRLNLAMQLLVSGSDSITAIARRCGYESEFYFSNSFRRALGMSPSAYRDLQRI